MIVLIGLVVVILLYNIIRDKISKKKNDRDVLLKKKISRKLDRVESKVDRQNKLFERLLDILEGED
jgi:hypothetical protein